MTIRYCHHSGQPATLHSTTLCGPRYTSDAPVNYCTPFLWLAQCCTTDSIKPEAHQVPEYAKGKNHKCSSCHLWPSNILVVASNEQRGCRHPLWYVYFIQHPQNAGIIARWHFSAPWQPHRWSGAIMHIFLTAHTPRESREMLRRFRLSIPLTCPW